MKNLSSFLRNSEKKVFDLEHRQRINYNISKYNAKVPEGKEQFEDFDLAKDKAAYVKRKVINNIEKYLIDFDNNFSKNGGEIFWANDASNAVKIII